MVVPVTEKEVVEALDKLRADWPRSEPALMAARNHPEVFTPMIYAAKYGRAAVAGVIDRFAEGEREEQRSREEREAGAKTDARAVRRTLVELGGGASGGAGLPLREALFSFLLKEGM